MVDDKSSVLEKNDERAECVSGAAGLAPLEETKEETVGEAGAGAKQERITGLNNTVEEQQAASTTGENIGNEKIGIETKKAEESEGVSSAHHAGTTAVRTVKVLRRGQRLANPNRRK